VEGGGWRRGPRARHTSAHKSTPRFWPQLEWLAGRDLSSTLTVTNNLDSGAGSLRAAIAAAQPDDVIRFAPDLDGQTITLTSGELDITQDLTIRGPGAGLLTVGGVMLRASSRWMAPPPT
jgi:hypothetical protein